MEKCSNGHPWKNNEYWQERNGKRYRSCKTCRREYLQRWRDKRRTPRSDTCRKGHSFDAQWKNRRMCTTCRHHYKIKRQFGIDYQEWLDKQEGRCAICRTDDPSPKRFFCTDHDHRTGKVRGLLCDRCNRGIECFRDDPKIIEQAMRYAEIHLSKGRRRG